MLNMLEKQFFLVCAISVDATQDQIAETQTPPPTSADTNAADTNVTAEKASGVQKLVKATASSATMRQRSFSQNLICSDFIIICVCEKATRLRGRVGRGALTAGTAETKRSAREGCQEAYLVGDDLRNHRVSVQALPNSSETSQ
jgi:hypothetical protein